MANLLAEMVNKVKRGHANNEHFVIVRVSRLLIRILHVLQREGVILGFSYIYENEALDAPNRFVKVYLKYFNGRPVLSNIEVVSRPGFRQYYSVGQLFKSMFKHNVHGFYILTTPGGVVTSTEVLSLKSDALNMSGEVLLKIMF